MMYRIHCDGWAIAFGDFHQFQIMFCSHGCSCVEINWALVTTQFKQCLRFLSRSQFDGMKLGGLMRWRLTIEHNNYSILYTIRLHLVDAVRLWHQ